MIQKLKSSPFFKNLATLISGTTLAQAIPFLISPIIARLYTPEDFGVLAIFVSSIAILATLATARYERAIILPKEDSKGSLLTVLSQYYVVLSAILLTIIVFFFSEDILPVFKAEQLEKYKWLIVLGVVILASDQIYYNWANRIGAYKQMSLSKVGNNLSSGLLQIGFGFLKLEAFGLLIAKLSGMLSSLAINFKTFDKKNFKTANASSLGAIATRYLKFPDYLAYAHLLNAVAMNGPPIVLAFYFNATEVGLFAMTQRVVMLPISLVARAVGDVFREKATKDFNANGTCRPLFLKTALGLFVTGLVPFLILLLLAPWMFEFFFGEQWIESGRYAQIFAFLFLFQFVVSPLTNMFMIAEKQALELVWQIAFFIASIFSIVVGVLYFDSLYEILVVFTIARALVYLIGLFFTFAISKKK